MLSDPPHNLEAEQAVLGSIIMRNEVYHDVCGYLTSDHFFEPEHAVLYSAMGRLIGKNRKVTPASLKGEIENDKYLGELARVAPTASIGRDMAKVVYDTACRRELVLIAQEAIQEASHGGSDLDVTDLIEGLEAQLLGLVKPSETQRQITLADAMGDAIEMVNAAYKRDTGMIGLPTGLQALDRLTGGLVDSELIILAGRPSMGKSALATNIALQAARQGTSVGFFTVEMSAQQLALRILGEQANVSSHRMRQGRIRSEEFDRIISEAEALSEANIQFDETGGITIDQLRSRARRWKRKYDIGLLVVDYLQLMSGAKRGGNRVQEVSDITTGLKAVAKDLKIPVLALSQLSRQVEQRDDKRPQLSDLRESGSIEQDADVVMFVFREEYYIERREPKEGSDFHGSWYAELMAAKGKADVIIGKQRHGPTGTVTLQFNPEFTKFSDTPVQAWREAAE